MNQIRSGAYFPQSYLTDMFSFLKQHKDKIEIITYADFDWGDDLDFQKGYPAEKNRWLEFYRRAPTDRDKAHLLIQYDLDSKPERSMSLLNHPAHRGVPANVMCFNKRVDRKFLLTTRELRYTEYDLDIGLLQSCESEGFVIGYHSNAYERSHFDSELAKSILDEDIEALRLNFQVNFYTAHGGVPCDRGLNNRDVVPNPSTIADARWVHNGATPFFNKQFSDGGHNSPKLDPATRDLRDFVSQMKPGGRYRILVHPQYYDVTFTESKRYSGTIWYDEMVRSMRLDSSHDSWGDVSLQEFPDTSEPYSDGVACTNSVNDPQPIVRKLIDRSKLLLFKAIYSRTSRRISNSLRRLMGR